VGKKRIKRDDVEIQKKLPARGWQGAKKVFLSNRDGFDPTEKK